VSRRALALLGSAAVHLCALAALLTLAASLREPQPLFVDLTVGSQAGNEREAGPPSQGRQAARAPARRAARPRPPAPRAPAPAPPAEPAEAAPAPAPSFSASPEAAPVEQGAQPGAADSAAREAGGVASDAPGRVGQATGAVGGGGSLLALAGPGAGRGEVPPEFGPYLTRFRERIQEALVYPLAARRRGLAGRVEVELLLEPSGRVRDLAVVSSSSHMLLDEAAVEAVRSIEPLPLPEHLPRRPLRVRLPIVFQLR